MKKLLISALLGIAIMPTAFLSNESKVTAAEMPLSVRAPKSMDVVLDDFGKVISSVSSEEVIGNNNMLRGQIHFNGGRFVCGTYTFPTEAAWGTKGSWARVYYSYGRSTARASIGRKNKYGTARAGRTATAKVYGKSGQRATAGYSLQ